MGSLAILTDKIFYFFPLILLVVIFSVLLFAEMGISPQDINPLAFHQKIIDAYKDVKPVLG
jgi:hypothetical protein